MSDPDPDRLRALQARIRAAKGPDAVREGSATGAGFSRGELAWRMVIELSVGMVLGLTIGYGLDRLFGTLPVFLIVFALLGFAAGIRTMLGTAAQMNAPQVMADTGGDAPPSDKDR